MPKAVIESKPRARATLTTSGVKAKYSSLQPASVEKVASVVISTGMSKMLWLRIFFTKVLKPAIMAPVLAKIFKEPPTMNRKAMMLIPPLKPLFTTVKKSIKPVGF